jgi:hypothetical protein
MTCLLLILHWFTFYLTHFLLILRCKLSTFFLNIKFYSEYVGLKLFGIFSNIWKCKINRIVPNMRIGISFENNFFIKKQIFLLINIEFLWIIISTNLVSYFTLYIIYIKWSLIFKLKKPLRTLKHVSYNKGE